MIALKLLPGFHPHVNALSLTTCIQVFGVEHRISGCQVYLQWGFPQVPRLDVSAGRTGPGWWFAETKTGKVTIVTGRDWNGQNVFAPYVPTPLQARCVEDALIEQAERQVEQAPGPVFGWQEPGRAVA